MHVVRDPEPGLGPLAGLATGLAVAGTRAEVAAVSAVDAPLAHPAVLAALIGALGTSPAVLPLGGQRPQPLFAVYRTELAFLAAALVADGERRASSLGERSEHASSSPSSCSSWTTSPRSIPASPRS